MGYYPRETIIEPGYIVDVCYRDDNPPAEVLSSECTYYPGYYDVTITVTCDNLSVAQRTQKVFLVATHDPEEHGTLVHAAGTTLPLGNEHRVAHVVFGKKSLNLGGRPVDYDINIFVLDHSENLLHGCAWVLFTHDKEDLLFAETG